MTGLQVLVSPRLAAVVAAAVLLVSAPLSAGELYQWKDANGVTHYADAPPSRGSYKNRRITDAGAGTANTASAASTEAPAENSQCVTARANLALLYGAGPVSMKGGAEGAEPSAMGPEQREAQKRLSEAAINAYCVAPAAQ